MTAKLNLAEDHPPDYRKMRKLGTLLQAEQSIYIALSMSVTYEL